VLTTSSCGSNPDGDGDVVGAQKCRCMMQTCSLAHWRQTYGRLSKLHLMCWGVLVHKFRNLTFFSLFAQASRSQEESQANTRPHLLKLGACDSAIGSVPTIVFACI